MTDLEILQNTINTLNNICVPVALVKDIGIPVYNSVVDLTNLYTAVFKQIKDAKEKQQQDDSEIQISDAEPVDEIPEGAEPISICQEEE